MTGYSPASTPQTHSPVAPRRQGPHALVDCLVRKLEAPTRELPPTHRPGRPAAPARETPAAIPCAARQLGGAGNAANLGGDAFPGMASHESRSAAVHPVDLTGDDRIAGIVRGEAGAWRSERLDCTWTDSACRQTHFATQQVAGCHVYEGPGLN